MSQTSITKNQKRDHKKLKNKRREAKEP